MNPLHQQINELEQLAAELHDYPGYSWAIDRIRRVVEDLERFEEPERCATECGAESADPAFEVWWHSEGSGMAPSAGEDSEEHVRRVSEIAWSNGAYMAFFRTHQVEINRKKLSDALATAWLIGTPSQPTNSHHENTRTNRR